MHLARALKIHAVPVEPAVDRELVALIRPPPVHIGQRRVLRPIRRCIAGNLRCRACIRNATVKIARRDDMQHHVEVLLVHLLEECRRIRKDLLVECERAVPRVPSRRTKAGSEIDQAVARQLLFAKSLRNDEHFLFAGQRAMRLQVTERPARRHVRHSRQMRILMQHAGGRVAQHQKNIPCRAGLDAVKNALGLAEFEVALRLADEDAPACGTEEPGNLNARAKGAQIGRGLAVNQPFTRSAAIEYVRAFPQTEDGAIQVEVNVGAVGVESNLLAQFAVFKHGHSERVLADTHGVFFPADLVSASLSLQRRWPFRRHHAKLPLDGLCSCRRDADA